MVVTRLAVGLDRQDGARLHGLAVQMDRAGATRRGVTADVGTGQPNDVADVVHEQGAWFDVTGVTRSVDLHRYLHGNPQWSLFD